MQVDIFAVAFMYIDIKVHPKLSAIYKPNREKKIIALKDFIDFLMNKMLCFRKFFSVSIHYCFS